MQASGGTTDRQGLGRNAYVDVAVVQEAVAADHPADVEITSHGCGPPLDDDRASLKVLMSIGLRTMMRVL